MLLTSCGAEKFVVSTDGSSFSGLGDDQEGHACNQTDADNSFKGIGSCPIHGSPGVAGHGVSNTSAGGVTASAAGMLMAAIPITSARGAMAAVMPTAA